MPAAIEGYVIPYFNVEGKPLPFYRVRLFDYDVRYLQLKGTPNHVYFPRNFKKVFDQTDGKLILITEGEKKAALAVKMGWPCIAFGGVDSWINKSITLPKDTQWTRAKYNDKLMVAKIPSADAILINTIGFAEGFEELCNLGLYNKSSMVIIYDTDGTFGTKPEVQRAASNLGHELRHRGFGIRQIRQQVLPLIPELDKTSLDSFLMHQFGGPKKLKELIIQNLQKPTTFPRHPNVRELIGQKLQGAKIGRKELQKLSLSTITELDARGKRMYSPDESQLYYFNQSSHVLMKVNMNTHTREQLQETDFGRLLYKDYGIAPSADNRLMQWLGAQFSAEDPIEEVAPHRIIARPKHSDNCIRFQVNNGEYIKVTGNPKGFAEVLENGAENVLFEAKTGAQLDSTKIMAEIDRQIQAPGFIENWWDEVLSGVRLKDHGKHRTLISLLYYISPWLYRWRGTQLPVELIVGESGSGKSTLCELRLDIILGDPALRNAPNDIKDWQASIANSGGLHVTDNVHFVDKSLRQRLSDEICRLITEPDPHIEQRKYYTNAEQIRIRVDPIFVFTAIQQPFHNADLIQRAFFLELDKSQKTDDASPLTFDNFWKQQQLQKRGGRDAWVAHHLIVLYKFLRASETQWNYSYKAKHRLINLEQILVIMARDVFGLEWEWIPQYLASTVEDTLAHSDMVVEALCLFVDHGFRNGRSKGFVTVKDITEWIEDQEDFSHNTLLSNGRALGKFLQTNKHMAATVIGLIQDGTTANRARFRLKRTARHKEV